ncbi:TetR/AcrR family transcriptional regulator [Actinomadura rupiterrae]|uniref:TetR/AcrR family transcriptional regulator n=1 Tax=Actinomadura rupiterrae TaxID=559627 RepID=UPI0020A23A00|nr:TetR/AcrR family transcriptional regulator [Actinomadura rupiterrae]MCP2338701.1 AcrR family transcriptional regulator [Actinomadura rupiterrae]
MGEEHDHLIATALRIFAELGYDGVTLQTIVDAAGYDINVVHSVARTKAEMYLAVMQHADDLERSALEAALARFTPSKQGVITLADAYLDFFVAHPHVLALWQHRWMGDAADLPDLEERYTRSLSVQIAGTIKDLLPPDVAPDYLVWSVVWCVYGFLSGGVIGSGSDQGRHRHSDSGGRDLEGFRTFLHTMLDHLLTPLPQRPPDTGSSGR